MRSPPLPSRPDHESVAQQRANGLALLHDERRPWRRPAHPRGAWPCSSYDGTGAEHQPAGNGLLQPVRVGSVAAGEITGMPLPTTSGGMRLTSAYRTTARSRHPRRR